MSDPRLNEWSFINNDYVTNNSGTLTFKTSCTIVITYDLSIYCTDWYAGSKIGLYCKNEWIAGPWNEYQNIYCTLGTEGTKTRTVSMQAGDILYVRYMADHGNQDDTFPNKVSAYVDIKIAQ